MARLALIVVILTILSGFAYALVQYGRTLEAAEWQKKVLEATALARSDEKRTQGAINDTLQRQYDEISTINDNLLADINELQNRPTRSSVSRDTKTNCKGVNGASLYAEDAIFLRGESARADKLRAALVSCYSYADSILTQ